MGCRLFSCQSISIGHTRGKFWRCGIRTRDEAHDIPCKARSARVPVRIFVPRVLDRDSNMHFLELHHLDDLVKVPPFGILEPMICRHDGTPRLDVLESGEPLELVCGAQSVCLLAGTNCRACTIHRLAHSAAPFPRSSCQASPLMAWAADLDEAAAIMTSLSSPSTRCVWSCLKYDLSLT